MQLHFANEKTLLDLYLHRPSSTGHLKANWNLIKSFSSKKPVKLFCKKKI